MPTSFAGSTSGEHDVVVELVEVATDKENVLRLLNNAAGTHITQGVAYTAKAKLKAGG
jgi:hypothetical protein